MQPGVSSGKPLIVPHLFLPTDPCAMAWEPFREGIDICRLYSAPSGASAAFLRYAKGARLDRHVHNGYEHIMVLVGSQIDDSGEHLPGTLLIHGPGTSHAVVSPGGCIVLAVWEKSVHFPSEDAALAPVAAVR